MNHTSTYIVLSQSSFIEDVLFNSCNNLSEHFELLKSRKILSDLILSSNTNLNLNNKYLLKSIGAIDSEEIVKLSGTKIQPSISFHEFAKLKYANQFQVKSPFVQGLGKLYLNKNSFPNCVRHDLRSVFAELISNSDDKDNSIFGLSSFNNQMHSFIPINIGNHRCISIIDESVTKINQILVNEKVFNVNSKLRVHLYPFGLIIKYIILSISCNSDYDNKDLIKFNEIFTKQKSNRIKIKFKNQTFDNLYKFLNFVDDRIECSIFKKEIVGNVNNIINLSHDLKSIICLNEKYIINDNLNKDSGIKEIVGLLNNSSDWELLSNKFIKKYDYSFEKYSGDIIISNSNKLVISYGLKYRNRREKIIDKQNNNFDLSFEFSKYKNSGHRVRSFWSLISVFELVINSKLLMDYYINKIELISTNPKFLNELEQLLNQLTNHYRKLDGPRRKFYYSICDSQRITEKYTVFKDKLNDIITNRKLNNIIEENTKMLRINLSNVEELKQLRVEVNQVFSNQQDIEKNIENIHDKISSVDLLSKVDKTFYEKLIKDRIGNELWQKFDNTVKKFFMSGEILYHNGMSDLDYSGSVIEYTKAIELLLNLKITNRLLDYLKNKNIEYIIIEKNKIGQNFKRQFTLGNFPYLINDNWNCELTKKEYKCNNFDNILDKYLNIYIFEEKIVASELQSIVNIRNKAAHINEVDKYDVDFIRDKLSVGTYFNEFLHKINEVYSPSRYELSNGCKA